MPKADDDLVVDAEAYGWGSLKTCIGSRRTVDAGAISECTPAS